MLGKILASSLTLSIGGSGGVFAPSLFIGAMLGMAFGTVAHHLFGPAVGPPAMYAVVAMGGVFAAAAQAPLTAIASVAEMTGNFGLTLPIMLACGIAAAVSKQLSYGSIYTTKLLRRGIDIERPRPTSVLQTLTVADVMQPVPQPNGDARLLAIAGDRQPNASGPGRAVGARRRARHRHARRPQELFGDETLEQALRQLVLYGRDGLPVLSHDGQHLQGWITRHDVLRALADSVSSSATRDRARRRRRRLRRRRPRSTAHTPSTPLARLRDRRDHDRPESPALGRRVGDDRLAGRIAESSPSPKDARSYAPHDTELRARGQLILLAPADPGAAEQPRSPNGAHRAPMRTAADRAVRFAHSTAGLRTAGDRSTPKASV